jgi:RNA polymerase sigma factor (sigma-70 family)
MVVAAGGSDSPGSRQALASLCEIYWYPVYTFIRRQGHTADEARDLEQGYFLQLLSKGYLKDLRPEAGRFRSFLLASVKHFLSNERDRERALKRGGGEVTVSLDLHGAEGRYALEPADNALTPDRLFEREWARTVLEKAMAALREDFVRSGETRRFERLKGYLTDEAPATPYREAAAELGMSESAVQVGVHRLRQRFGSALREVIAQTVADPADIDDEIRCMLSAIG